MQNHFPSLKPVPPAAYDLDKQRPKLHDLEQLELEISAHDAAEITPSQTAFMHEQEAAIAESRAYTGPFMREVCVFGMDDIHEAALSIPTSSSDHEAQSRLKATLTQLLASNGMRALATPEASWQGQLDELRAIFPNFCEAIDCVEASVAIMLAGGVSRPPPLLLVGSPGVGKTHFCESIAKMMNTPFVNIDMSSAQMGSVLDGSAAYWANSAPGQVFKTLAFAFRATANPVFLLDELDKVGNDLKFDPRAALYSLLEVESAKRFEDQSLPGIFMDASHIRWLGSCNDTAPIPPPLLSRMHVIEIPDPTPSQKRQMYMRIFSGAVKSVEVKGFSKAIPSGVIERAAGAVGPRAFKTACVSAIGRALVRGRYDVIENDFENARRGAKRSMGFV